ncbi:Protein of unknown function, partial [Gryllus bimaculatus]
TKDKVEGGVEDEAEARVEARTEARVEARTGARVEARTGARVEARAEARVEDKAKARVENKAEARVVEIEGSEVLQDFTTRAPFGHRAIAKLETVNTERPEFPAKLPCTGPPLERTASLPRHPFLRTVTRPRAGQSTIGPAPDSFSSSVAASHTAARAPAHDDDQHQSASRLSALSPSLILHHYSFRPSALRPIPPPLIPAAQSLALHPSAPHRVSPHVSASSVRLIPPPPPCRIRSGPHPPASSSALNPPPSFAAALIPPLNLGPHPALILRLTARLIPPPSARLALPLRPPPPPCRLSALRPSPFALHPPPSPPAIAPSSSIAADHVLYRCAPVALYHHPRRHRNRLSSTSIASAPPPTVSGMAASAPVCRPAGSQRNGQNSTTMRPPRQTAAHEQAALGSVQRKEACTTVEVISETDTWKCDQTSASFELSYKKISFNYTYFFLLQKIEPKVGRA